MSTMVERGKLTDWTNYRMLAEGEIIQEGDECLTDSHLGWRPAAHTVGQPAPDPYYTGHRMYRRAMSEIPEHIDATSRRIVYSLAIMQAGTGFWSYDDMLKIVAEALLAAEKRGKEEAAKTMAEVHDLLRADDRYGALAHLPYGGVECERLVEQAVDILAAAIRGS